MAEKTDYSHRAMLLTFGAFGAMVGSHAGSLPVLVDQAGVTPWQFGLAGSLSMLASILCMSVGGFINRLAGHRTVLLLMLPLAALALLFAVTVASVAAFLISFAVLGGVLGVIDLFMNAEASAVEEERRKASFNTYHGSVMLALASFALVGSVLSVGLAPLAGAALAMLPLALAWHAIFTHTEPRPPRGRRAAAAAAPLPWRLLALVGLAAGFNVTCEVAAIQWSGQLLEATAPDLAAISGLGIAFYGACVGTMRLFGDRIRTRHGDLRIMACGLALAIAGFLILGSVPGFWISVLAFAGVGFGLAVIFPSLFSLIGRLAPASRASAMSFASLVSGLPRITLPFAFGAIAASEGISAVFGAMALVAGGALLLIIAIYRSSAVELSAK